MDESAQFGMLSLSLLLLLSLFPLRWLAVRVLHVKYIVCCLDVNLSPWKTLTRGLLCPGIGLSMTARGLSRSRGGRNKLHLGPAKNSNLQFLPRLIVR